MDGSYLVESMEDMMQYMFIIQMVQQNQMLVIVMQYLDLQGSNKIWLIMQRHYCQQFLVQYCMINCVPILIMDIIAINVFLSLRINFIIISSQTYDIFQILLLQMLKDSIIFSIFTITLIAANQLCPHQCQTCSSSTQCVTCAQQFYPSVLSPTLSCLPCPSYCLVCSSSDSCTACVPPYSLIQDTETSKMLCKNCEILYSQTCSSPIQASKCQSKYYLSDNYCLSCLLNCQNCNSNADCESCISGYYLNTTVLTCNPCKTQKCRICDQYNPLRCIECQNGYQLLPDYSCSSILCENIGPCEYCSSINYCAKCSQNYYWASTSNKCIEGSSILCMGAVGVYPNQCVQCSPYSYSINTGVTTNNIQNQWCKPYINIDRESVRYHQTYYYAQNDEAELQSLFGTANNLIEVAGEKMYKVSENDKISLPTLPSFYRISFTIKYKAVSEVSVKFSATTESSIQEETSSFRSASNPSIITYQSSYLHSNNLYVEFSGSQLFIVELLIRLTKCPEDCYRCLNEQFCQMCNNPQYVSSYKCVDNCTIYYHYVQNRSCLSSCPEKFYPNSQIDSVTNQPSKYCEPCVSPCETCTSSTRCLSCVEGQYLGSSSVCLTTCPPTTYPSDADRTCQTCISPCKQCISPIDCTSCSFGFFNGNKCVNSCPDGTFGNNSTNTCEACQAPCTKCEVNSQRCLECQNGFYYYDFNCFQKCLDRFYENDNTKKCEQCVTPCLTCSSASVCISCVYNYFYAGSCIPTCPSGYYANQTSKECTQCTPGCLQCVSTTVCVKCEKETCLLNGGCLASCPQNQYYDILDNNGFCSCNQCVHPCRECSSAKSCLSCIQGYLHGTQCRSVCPDQYYPDNQTFKCTICSQKFAGCVQCTGSGCTRCSTNKYLHNGQCLDACPQFHYQESQKCMKCIAPCKSCSSFTACLSCISPYALLEGSDGNTCLIQCPSSYVSIFDVQSSSNKCEACQSPCLSCQLSSTNCTFCQYSYFLNKEPGQDNVCIKKCSDVEPKFSLFNEPVTSQCTSCIFPCKQCLSQTKCVSCRIGYLNGYECKQCDNGYYQKSGVCELCPVSCKNCFGPQHCVTCSQGYYLYGFQCINDTSICTTNGYYVLGRVCQRCQMPCKTCILTGTNCQSCVSGYIFHETSPSKCITECLVGTYREETSCKSCHEFCETCSNSATYCFSCKSPYLLVLAAMSCRQDCPQKSYLSGNICQACKYPCQDCLSDNECKSCLTGSLVGTSCLTSCPSGQFTNSEQICEPCTSPCQQCELKSTNCTLCQQNYYLFNNQCLEKCPTLYFGESQAKQCLECLGLCEQCSSHVNCISCPDNLIYYFNEVKEYAQCVSECPISYYANVNTSVESGRIECQKCLEQCLTCVDDLSCILCKDNKVQYQGQCFEQCPSQMYSSSGICQPCSQPCLNCSDPFTCTACMNDSFLLVGSAECVIGETCPQGFYRITGTRLCNSNCPPNQYHQSNRTCSALGCSIDEYLGLDFYCYLKCPAGTKADSNYICRICKTQQECSSGLFYEIKYWIQSDEVYLSIQFTQEPIYSDGITKPQIELIGVGDIKYKLISSEERRRILQNFLKTKRLSSKGSKDSNIIIQLFPQASFTQLSVEVRFVNALKTFKNPIQRTSKKIMIEGYDKYPDDLVSVDDSKVIIGLILLICALIGLVRNPYLTDFCQIIYAYALVNLHYPVNLASFLQASYLVQLIKIVDVPQPDCEGNGKFSYVASMGLLQNSTFNLIVIGVGLIVFGIMFLVYKALQKSLNYNKVEEEEPSAENNKIYKQASSEQQTKNTENKKLQCFLFLKGSFIENFMLLYLNRLIYINYFPLVIFTFAQLNTLSFESDYTATIAASCLSLATTIFIVSYPILVFIKIPKKPKYTFLLIRKIILGVALVLSRQNPEYFIGVLAVISLMTGILIKAYSLEKISIEPKVLMGLQIAQFVIAILLASFVMIIDGALMNVRLLLSWIIIVCIIFTLLAYLAFETVYLGVWLYLRKTGINLWEKWLTEQTKQETEDDSQSGNDSHSSDSEKKQNAEKEKSKTITLDKLVKDTFGEQQNAKLEEQKGKQGGHKKKKNNNMFWTYNEDDSSDQQEDNQQGKAPKMLIRCVNEFSEVGENQNANDDQQ